MEVGMDDYRDLWKLVADLEAGKVLGRCPVCEELVARIGPCACGSPTVVIDPAELAADLVEDEGRVREFMATVTRDGCFEVVN
jgi:hypothetical protein